MFDVEPDCELGQKLISPADGMCVNEDRLISERVDEGGHQPRFADAARTDEGACAAPSEYIPHVLQIILAPDHGRHDADATPT